MSNDLVLDRSHKPLLHVKREKKKHKGIRKVKPERRLLNEEYKVLRRDFLEEHPYCQHFLQENGIDETVAKDNLGIVLVNRGGSWGYIHVPKASQIHHRRGRVGNLLVDIRYFLAVSEAAHTLIHHDTKTSYEKGYMLPR